MIPVFHLQRDPRYWQDAEVFQPERFLEDDITNAMPAYLPFGAGERACIGREFAMMEASISIAIYCHVIKSVWQMFEFLN